MIDYDLLEATTTRVHVVDTVPTVTEQVVVRPLTREHRSTDLMVAPEQWEWEQVRDYVVRQIEQYHGPFPRNFKTEHSIFKSFCSRWGQQAGPIAVRAFEEYHGLWRGAPITVNRFCKGSDAYFAAVLAR